MYLMGTTLVLYRVDDISLWGSRDMYFIYVLSAWRQIYTQMVLEALYMSNNEYVISTERGKFFKCKMDPTRCKYCLPGESKWHEYTGGYVIYRWPGMMEIVETCDIADKLVKYETFIREMKKTEMLRRIEKKYPLRDWIAGDTSKHRAKRKTKKWKI